MKKRLDRRPALPVLILGALAFISWGISGHEHINHAAVFALPSSPVKLFFYTHLDFITQEATVPDLRKYTLMDKAESPRHFVALENYGHCDSLPLTLEKLRANHDEDFLSRNGILPWYIMNVMDKLTRAFREKRKTEVLFLAADLGHYLGDAHMPLHTSVYRDGREPAQKGVHALWEAHLPDLFGSAYSYRVDGAAYISDIRKATWAIILSSHQLVDTMLITEQRLRETFAGNVFEKNEQGETVMNKFNQPVHALEYATKYHERLDGMVERQMRRAILATACFWHTAWVNAGSPDLADLDPEPLRKENAKRLNHDETLWRKGSMTVLKSEREF